MRENTKVFWLIELEGAIDD